jgi:hypothetical protein
MQKFFAKRWLFFILDFGLKRPKNPKRASRGSHEGNKFCILDGTKHILKILAFYTSSLQSS